MVHTAKKIRFTVCIPRKEFARPQSQFLHLYICDDLYIPTIGLPIFLQPNIQIAHRYMNVEIRTDAAQSFLEHFVPIFGPLSLQCISEDKHIFYFTL